MKKMGIFIIIIAFLVGCQSEVAITPLVETEVYTHPDELEFNFIKVEVIDQIAASNKNKVYPYIKPTNSQNVFVDMVIRTVNLSSKEKELKSIYNGQFESNGKVYAMKRAVETVNYTRITTTDTLKTNEVRYVHLYAEIPQEQIKDPINATFRVLDTEDYEYTFSPKEIIINNNAKSLGDVLTLDQSQIALNNIVQSSKIEPSNKGVFYSYISPDNKDEVFITLQLDLKNTSDVAIQPEDYIYCEYVVGDEAIKSQIIIESVDHKTLAKTGVVQPAQTRTIYLAMPVKSSLLKEEGRIYLFVEGKTYEINNSHKAN